MLKKYKGITLIALVVTIVVIIILAGTSFAVLLGENGIITKAIEAKEKQKIAELTEMLNLEKGSLAIEKQGVVTVEEYLKYIEEKGIIVGAENEVIQEGSVHITVDNGYIFLIEKISENDIKIEYQGKAGKLLPRIIKVEITNTTSSINLKVTSIRTEKYEYHIKKEDETDYTKKSEGTNAEYTFEGLEQNVIYNVKIVAKNKNGEVEEIKNVLTGEIELPELGDYSPKGWTKEDVTITLPKKEGYTTQYQIGGIAGTWINYKDPFTIGENKTIYYCYTDGTNKSNYASLNIQNIDKETPTSNVRAGNVANKKVMLTLEGTDNKSGISEYRIYEDGNLIKTITSNNTSETYEHTTTFGEKEIYVIAKDLVGNEKQSGTIKIEDLEISNLEEIKKFRDNVNTGNTYEGKTIKQTSNIDMQGSQTNQWTPIGNTTYYFMGTYNGQNNTITNIYINNSLNNQGLFRIIRNTGVVKNVKVLNSTISGENSVGSVSGSVSNNGQILNCESNSTITGNMYIGGIVGDVSNSAKVDNCINNGQVTGESYIGGITGLANLNTIISNCTNNTKVDGNILYIGGIVGANQDSSVIDRCNNKAPITGKSNVGGVTGINIGSCTVQSSYNTGIITVTTDTSAGGIVGNSSNNGKIIGCYNTGKVIGVNYTGGIVGSDSKGQIINCYNLGEIKGSTNYTGGIVGAAHTSTIAESYNNGIITGNIYTGGIVGITKTASRVDTCYNKQTITGVYYSGGIVGTNEDGTVTVRCYNLGNVLATTNYRGAISSVNVSSTIDYCYTLSTASNTDICQVNNGGTIQNSIVKTVAEMKASNFVTLLNTAITTNPWKQDTTSKNEGYPILSWQ